jgi:hypothetical protein
MMRLRSVVIALWFSVAGCAQDGRPAAGPAGRASDPSYGNGNMNGGWSDPAASGYANHGSGQVGTTTRATGEAHADGGTP